MNTVTRVLVVVFSLFLSACGGGGTEESAVAVVEKAVVATGAKKATF